MTTLAALAIVIPAIFLTSLLSGMAGMAGGLILIVVLVLLMPVPSAMILHGIVQGAANGSRCWFLREHIAWRVVPWYCIGAGTAVLAFLMFTIVVEPAVVLIAAGAMPWVTQFTPKRFKLDVTKASVSICCGLVTTSVQLIAGASGPVLDAFYQRASLNRFEVVATKALTQTIGHAVKVGYYAYIGTIVLDHASTLVSWWFICIAVALALLGTRIGTLWLPRVSEAQFRRYTNVLILALGSVAIIGGATQLFSQN